MPLPEMPAGVSRLLEEPRQRDLFGPDGEVRRERAVAVGMPPRHDAAARGGAHRSGGVEAVEAQAARGHIVEYRRANVRMAVIAGFVPAVIVAHAQNDVGPLGGTVRRERGALREEAAPGQGRHNASVTDAPAIPQL